MQLNRYFKTTVGVPVEAVIAQFLDASNAESPAVGNTAATATFTTTVAGSPTAGDQQVITVGGHEFHYEVQSADTTAALYGTALLAYLNAEAYSVANSIVWTKSGTTTLVLTATWASSLGAGPNGTITGNKAGSTNAGPTFSGLSSTNAVGGTYAIPDFQANYKLFVANALAGALAVYWDDTNLAVQPGETGLYANRDRKFFYAWKNNNTTYAYRTTGIPCSNRKYTSAAYAAGQGDIITVAAGAGTYATGQILHVRIIDKTASVIPYPNWEYQATITANASDTAMTAIAAAINAETQDPVATASATTSTLTVTGTYKNRKLQVVAWLETSPSQTTDASNFVFTYTQKMTAPIGDNADITEFENFEKRQQALIRYAPDGTTAEEFQAWASNVSTSINYGYLIVTATFSAVGETRGYTKKRYIIVALPTASLATLASF